jgi:hypothetical protein
VGINCGSPGVWARPRTAAVDVCADPLILRPLVVVVMQRRVAEEEEEEVKPGATCYRGSEDQCVVSTRRALVESAATRRR